jgi:flagellar biogenesis protein FliO
LCSFSQALESKLEASKDNTVKELLKEEQQPLIFSASEGKKKDSSPIMTTILFILFTAGASVGGVFLMKFLQKKGKLAGSRKYLIENLSYVPLGSNNKNAVCLIKVGSEFVLVGVSPQQVTFLSHLPKLESQYESESKFERNVFEEAIQEELNKMQPSRLTV